jgi:hypothetical protein
VLFALKQMRVGNGQRKFFAKVAATRFETQNFITLMKKI